MAEERKQINVRVSPKTADDWDDWAEEMGFKSRAGMIRRAVKAFRASQTGEDGAETDEEVLAQLDALEDKLDILRSDVMDVRREQLTTEDVDDIAQEVAYSVEVTSELIAEPEDIESYLEDTMDIDELDDRTRQVAFEQFLRGFARAVEHVEDEEERERLETIRDGQIWELQFVPDE